MNKELISKYLFFVGVILFFIGLFFSRALLSISPALLLISAFTHSHFKQNIKQIHKNRVIVFPFVLYMLGVVCYPLVENQSKWAELLFKNLPYIIFPFSIIILKDYVAKYYKFIFYTCILFVTFIITSTLIRLINNYELYTWMIQNSKNIEATGGLFHIHFGIITTLSIIFCYGMIRFSNSQKIEKYILSIIAIYLFVVLHVLAYRTGMVAVYVCVLAEILIEIFRSKKYLIGALLIASAIIIPIIAYKTITPFKERIENTKYDIYRYKSGKDINYYSLSQRFAAWENALVIYKKNIVFGTSAADLEDEMMRQYELRDFGLKKENQVLIHNQYIFYAVCYGTVGLLFLIYFLANTFTTAWRNQKPVYILFSVLFIAVFVIDTILEMQTGQNMFVFFYSILAFVPLTSSKHSV
jgi:O-antigen ligase